MKRFLIIFVISSLILNFCACSNVKNGKTIQIGIIDSCISPEIQNKYNIVQVNDIVGVKTDNNITHGSMILSIISKNVPNCEIFYCSVLNEKCNGKIQDVANAIDWCISNKVDIITMSFATLTDDDQIRKSVEEAIKSNIIITASCVNLSDVVCYPAMYNGVISVSEGFNTRAQIILKGKKVKFEIDGTEFEKREVSFLTAYVCGSIAKQLSDGKTIEAILKKHDFN